MEPGMFPKQVLSYQRSLFESAFNAMCAVQDQTEQMTETMLKQMNWMPEDTKKSLRETVEMYKKARENYKKSVEEGFDRMEEMFTAK
jgi:hypothetical protein